MPGSTFGANILKNLNMNYKGKDTSINFSYGGNNIEVHTGNIQNLVKKFARNMYKAYDVDIETGKLNEDQF